MKSTRKNGLIITIILALLSTFSTYLVNEYGAPAQLAWIEDALVIIETPALFVGFAVSGNIHMPNPMATYAVLFVTYLLLAAGITWLISIMLARRAPRS